jgi:CheY-like chemotaxis protein
MNPLSILMVEDNREDEMLTLRSLQKAHLGNAVDVVRDGQQALDFLFREGEFQDRPGTDLPAFVLLDLGLPRLGGLDVLARIRADPRTSTLPVVIFTSSSEEEDRLASALRGANSFVRKPIEFAAFAERVARLGIYWLAVNERPGGAR